MTKYKTTDPTAQLLGCLLAILFIIAFSLFGGRMFQLIWNAVMPVVFGSPYLTFW